MVPTQQVHAQSRYNQWCCECVNTEGVCEGFGFQQANHPGGWTFDSLQSLLKVSMSMTEISPAMLEGKNLTN
jgi:hypothetical protein